MAEYIDKQALIDATDDRYSLGEIGRMERDIIVDAVTYAKPADVRPVKSGKWEVVHGVCTPGGDPWLRCPFCKDEDSEHLGGIEMPKKWNWCPVCGAELKGWRR